MLSTEINFDEDIALLRGDSVKLPFVANFLESVYKLGLYEERRDYTKAVKQHIKAVDQRILALVLAAATIQPNDMLARDEIIWLGQIRFRLECHWWRAERIADQIKADEARRRARAA